MPLRVLPLLSTSPCDFPSCLWAQFPALPKVPNVLTSALLQSPGPWCLLSFLSTWFNCLLSLLSLGPCCLPCLMSLVPWLCRILRSVLLTAAVIVVRPVLIIEVGTHWWQMKGIKSYHTLSGGSRSHSQTVHLWMLLCWCHSVDVHRECHFVDVTLSKLLSWFHFIENVNSVDVPLLMSHYWCHSVDVNLLMSLY